MPMDIFFLANYGERYVYPVVVLTHYYAYFYYDGPQADADVKYNGQNEKNTADRFSLCWCLWLILIGTEPSLEIATLLFILDTSENGHTKDILSSHVHN